MRREPRVLALARRLAAVACCLAPLYLAACAGGDSCADGVFASVRASDPTHVSLSLRCSVSVSPDTLLIDDLGGAPGSHLAVRDLSGGDRTYTLTTDPQRALVTYTVRLNGPLVASANFVGVGKLDRAPVTLSVDDRYDQTLAAVSVLVTVDPETGVFTDYATTVPLADPDGDHVWTARLDVAVDALRTVSTLDDRLGPGRRAYAARAVTPEGAPLSNLVTFEVRKPDAARVDLPLLSVPRPPGPEGLVTVTAKVDDRPAQALTVPRLRVSTNADGAFDASFPTTIALDDGDRDHVWTATFKVRIDPNRRIGGATSETFPYVAFVQNAGKDYPNVNAQIEALGETPVDADLRVGNPALIPVTFRVDTSRAYLNASGTLRGVYPGEAVFLTGELGTAEDAFGQNAADHFSGGENVVLEMAPRGDHPGVWERTLFLGPNRTYAWKAVRCPSGKGCSEINRHVTSSGRAFATVMKNLATENRDAQAAPAVKIVDVRAPQVRLDDGRTLDYAGAQVYLGNGTGLEPNPSGLPDGARMFKQEMPDLVVTVGTAPIATPVMVAGTWRDVNLPKTLAQIIADNTIFDLNPWDYEAGFVGMGPPSYVLAAPPPFQIGDGARDAQAVAIPGGTASTMTLHAAVSGKWLYVATETTGAGSDHFLLVSQTAPGAPVAAPWGKAGTVAFPAGTLFLAGENDSGFSGWFQLGGAQIQTSDAVSAKNGVLEGMIDLEARFGAVPATLYLAVAPYGSADGGALYPSGQCPKTTNADGNIDAGEIATVVTSGITVP